MAKVGARCPVCGRSSVIEVVTLPSLPVAINAQVTPESGPSVARGDFELVVCGDCSHMFNAAFDPEISAYDSSYENSLHFSPRFRDHASSLAERLVADHGLVGSTAAEAGSGPGHFLAMLCQAGVAKAYGFDPSYDPQRLGAPEHPDIEVTEGYFPGDGSLSVKMALSQHVLEHLSDPVELLGAMRTAVADHPGGVVYSEVPNGDLMLDRCAMWDLIYEHFSYFTSVSLGHACRRAGLTSSEVLTMFDGQFMAMESTPTSASDELPSRERVEPLVDQAVAFGEQVGERILSARQELERHLERGPLALWGAGSKGRTYLNLVATAGEVNAIVDVNPRKAGFGIPGVSGVVTGPESLIHIRPATVLIANPVYREEISASVRELGVEADVVPLWD